MINTKHLWFFSALLFITFTHQAQTMIKISLDDYNNQLPTSPQNGMSSDDYTNEDPTEDKKRIMEPETMLGSDTDKKWLLPTALVLSAAVAAAIIYKAIHAYNNSESTQPSERLQIPGSLSLLEENIFQVTNTERRACYGPRITIVQGDITQQQFTDYQRAAIVNAANEHLAHGAGIARAIDLAAGPELGNYQRRNNISCPTGQARITPAFNLANRHVCANIIHTVGPIGAHPDQLRNAYNNSLILAEQQGITAIAFPAISTGIFGYPLAAATQVALETAISYIQNNPNTQLQEIRFVAYDARNLATYRQITQQFLIQ
jgi:O-acetyl-ADP-ribose deacetylase (regulator of RNase III)